MVAAHQLLPPRIVGRIDVVDCPWPNAMELNNGRLFGPSKMIGSGLHDRHTTWWQRHSLFKIELVSSAHVECSGQDRYVFGGRMRVSRNSVIRREPEPDGERRRRIHWPLNHCYLCPWRERRDGRPLQLGRHNHGVRRGLRRRFRRQATTEPDYERGNNCNASHNFLLLFSLLRVGPNFCTAVMSQCFSITISA